MNIKKSKNYKKNHNRVFVSGVLILSCSTVLVKLLGLAYKIPMLSLLGAEGMGYFNSAYEIYALLCLVATTGLPVAISMLVSAANVNGQNNESKAILNSATKIALLFGVVATCLLIVLSKDIALFIGNPRASKCIVAIAPSLLFVCISGVYRGYFQGLNQMYPTAISQLIETVGKLTLGVFFVSVMLSRGIDTASLASFAAWGLTIGMFMSSLYLFVNMKWDGRKNKLSVSKEYKLNRISKTLLKISVPITLSSIVIGSTRIIDMTLILRRLQDIGIGVSEANQMYGAYTTLAVPVFGLIPSLIAPVSLALIPGLSSAIERKDALAEAEVANNAIRLTILLALPSSMAIATFSNAILGILFSGEQESVDFASPLLAILGASVLFSCLITTTNAVLHSYRKTVTPIISMACGCLVKLVSAYFLIGDSSIGIIGAPISTLLCDLTVTLINLINVVKCIPEVKGTVNSLWRVFVASLGAIAASLGVYVLMNNNIQIHAVAFIGAVVVAVIVYFVLIFAVRAITVKDLEMLPMGDRISVLFIKKKS